MTQDGTGWFDEHTATLGDRITAGREGAGLSVAALAKKIGVKTGTVKKWEQDLSEPRANHLSTLAGVLNVSLSWLLMGRGEGPGAPDLPQVASRAELIGDLRQLRVELTRMTDRMAVLEKRLSQSLQEPSHD